MISRLSQIFGGKLGGWTKKASYAFWAPVLMLGLIYLWNEGPLKPLALQLENVSENLRFQARAPFDPPADPRLLYVGIDQPTLDHLGAWPWPRNVEADFLTIMAQSGQNPSVVAFDIMMADDFDKFHVLQLKNGKSFDQILGDATALLPCVITGAFYMDVATDAQDQKDAEARTRDDLSKPSQTAPYPHVQGDIQNIYGSDVAKFPVAALREESLFGFVNVGPVPPDGIRRLVPLVFRVRDQVFPSLSLQILCQMLNVDPDKVQIVLGKSITLLGQGGKSWTIPIDEKGSFTVNYRRDQSFPGVSFYKLFSALSLHVSKGDPLPALCNIDKKVVFVGGAAIGLNDLGTTPFASNVPLCYTHLNILNDVLRNDYIKPVAWYWVVLGWLLVTWLTLYNFKNASIRRAVVGPLLIAACYIGVAFAIFASWSVLIDLVWPVLAYIILSSGAVVLRWLEESRGREKLKKTFVQMVSPDLMNSLLDHPERLQLGGTTRAVTVLFSDIRSFTSMSELTGNEELVRQLNRYFDRMVRCILDYRGTLHGFSGDGIMAVWGDVDISSSGTEKDARNAVRSAVKMRVKLVELNQERVTEGLPPFRIGMGLNFGEVLAGQLGASIRSQFSVIGDTVNVASRIEGVTKEFGTDLAIGEDLRKLLGSEFIVRRLGRIQLKGKKKAILAYEVLAEAERREDSSWKQNELAEYEMAFDYYLGRRFADAITVFTRCLAHHPDDFGVNYYLKSSKQLMENPPAETWDGRVVMETK